MGRGLPCSLGHMPGFHVTFNVILFFNTIEMLQKIIDSKSLENSQENIMMEFDLVKLQFCNLNTATLT